MKVICGIVAILFLGAMAMAEEIKFEGTYKTQFKNDRPNKVEGGVTKKDDGTWEGELRTDWKGKIEVYKGTMTGNLQSGEVKGDFHMMAGTRQGRHFVFTCKATNGRLRGKTFEIKGGKEVPTGDLEMKPVK